MKSVVGNLLALLVIVLFASSWVYFLYYLSGPDERLQFPRNLTEVVTLKSVLEEYARTKPSYTLLFFGSVYLYKQSFAIPGSVFLNLLIGALFGVVKGFIICCFLSSTGASCCFILSKYFGRAILMRYLSHRVAYFQQMVESSRDNKKLFTFLLSIRIFPMTPNWLINMASPIVGVPLKSFFLSVLIGLAPYNFLTCNAGSALADLKSLDDIITWKVALGMGLFAVAILNPVKLLKKVNLRRRS